MATYDELHAAKASLIRKALGGTILVAPMSVSVPDKLMADATNFVDLKSLGYIKLGWLTKSDGINFSRDQEQSETESLGSQEPTRIDFTKDTTSAAFRCQETNKQVLELYLNKKLDGVKPDQNGEVSFESDRAPGINYYRVIYIARDGNGDESKYIIKVMPRAVISETQELAMNPESELSYGMTLKATVDEELGFAVRHVLCGPGFANLWEDMGFTA